MHNYQILEDSYYFQDYLQEVEDRSTIFSFHEWMNFYYPDFDVTTLIPENSTYPI